MERTAEMASGATRPLPLRHAPLRTLRSRRPRLWRALRVALALMLALAVILSASGVYLYQRLSATVTSYPPSHFNRGENAVWLEHTWAGDYHTAQDYDALAAQPRSASRSSMSSRMSARSPAMEPSRRIARPGRRI